MKKCGLLGKNLSHSYSPIIHENFRNFYAYHLYEMVEESLADIAIFFDMLGLYGLNVTIPYKEAIIPFLDELSETAREVGSVNTIIRRDDGTFWGDNTDVFGFTKMVAHLGVDVSGKKALVLGSGGASKAVVYALKRMGAQPFVISRNGDDNYENLERHADAELIVNATPVGMYPEPYDSPIDLSQFKSCEAVYDLIYNPLCTKLLLQARELGIPYENGLYMLVSQAVRSAELFKGEDAKHFDEADVKHFEGASILSGNAEDAVDFECIGIGSGNAEDALISQIYKDVKSKETNVIFIGMPGCGKSSIGKAFAEATGREFIDTDEEIFARTGRRPADIILEDGEEAFRTIESGVLADVCRKSSVVIATGGGVVTKDENYSLLHQNGIVIWINLALSLLEQGGRPLSDDAGVEKIYAKRRDLYDRFADIAINIEADDALVRLVYKVAIDGLVGKIREYISMLDEDLNI